MLTKIGTGEIIVILLIALFIVGPERLPKLAKSVGKAIAGFKRYMNDVTDELKESSEEFKDISSEVDKVRKDVTDTIRTAGSDIMDDKPAKGKAAKAKQGAAKAAGAKVEAQKADAQDESAPQTTAETAAEEDVKPEKTDASSGAAAM
ncbi:MAG: Sec-independent protein translocase protein TatB [Clostridia bacterium]|nr:Sec-independent protein translocase protein TatB [Clostridia bacterium]